MSCAPLLDKYTYASFSYPSHSLRPIPTATTTSFDVNSADTSQPKQLPPSSSEQTQEELKAENGDDDNTSEGDVDEVYEQSDALPVKIWMEVLLAESINNGRVECVPAPVSYQ